MGLWNPTSWLVGGLTAAAKAAAAAKNQGSSMGSGAGNTAKPSGGSSGGSTSGNLNGGLSGGTSYVNGNGEKKGGVFVPSASGVGVNNSTQQKIKDQMNANSQAWHTADAATKKRLEQDNQTLSGQLGGSLSYNPNSGRWSGNAGYDAYGDEIDNQNKWLQDWESKNDRISADAEAATRAGVEQAVGGLAGQKEGINQSYSDLFRQLYIDKMKGERDLPQQMAAMGYTGGLSESALMDMQNGYANSLRQGEQQRVSSLSDIDRAISDTRLQGDISIAEQAAQMAQQGLVSYTDLIRAMQDRNYQYGRDALADKRYDTEWTYGMAQDSLTAARTEVDRILASGGVPPADLVSKANYTPAYVQAQQNAYLQQSKPKGGGYSGGGGGGGNADNAGGQDFAGLFSAAANSPNPSNFIASNYKKYGFTSVSGLQDQYIDFNKRSNSLNNISNGIQSSLGRNPDEMLIKEVSKWMDDGMSQEMAQALLRQFGIDPQFVD